MTTKQISIFLENKPGQLAGICRTLAQADINIATLSLADTADFGIVRMIVDDHAKGCEVLSAAGFAVRETDVVTATVPNRPGGMAEITAKLDAAGADTLRRCCSFRKRSEGRKCCCRRRSRNH